MADPSPGSRRTPGGVKLADGFSSEIVIEGNTTISFFEKQVTPPAVDGGDGVEQTTMFNDTWRTMLPRDLKSIEDITATVAYDSTAVSETIALINTNTTITVIFPDNSTIAFFGFLKRFEPGALVKGEQPEATVTITPTNVDPADPAIEAGPVFTQGAGTY